MKIQSKILPDNIIEKLKQAPETGMGYQIVTVLTREGKHFEKVLVINCSEISTVNGQTEIPFDANEVVNVVVTHDKSL